MSGGKNEQNQTREDTRRVADYLCRLSTWPKELQAKRVHYGGVFGDTERGRVRLKQKTGIYIRNHKGPDTEPGDMLHGLWTGSTTG